MLQLTVFPYGIALAGGILLSLLWLDISSAVKNVAHSTASFFGVLALPLGFICARIGYCLVNFGWFKDNLSFFFEFSRGGYLLYGALVGIALALWFTAKRTRQSFAYLADWAIAPVMLFILVSRLAEGLVGVGYGRNISEWFDPWMEETLFPWEDPSALFTFPFAMQDYYEEWNFAIYMVEALTALIIIIIVLCSHKRRSGGKAVLGLLLYASLQIYMESMRQDSLRWGFVKADQILSAAVIVGMLVLCCYRTKGKKIAGVRFLAWGGTLACCGIILMMEFAMEQKINFLVWMKLDVCYMVSLLATVLLCLVNLPLWRKAFHRIK